MISTKFPRNVAEHLASQLSQQPGGTRVVLVWDPEGHVSAGVDVVDSSINPWHTIEFSGNDAEFASAWAARPTDERTVVLLHAPSTGFKARSLDLSFQERLLYDADSLLDISLRAVLKAHTSIEWNSDAVRDAGSIIVKNLAGTLDALSCYTKDSVVGRRHLVAAALAATTPTARMDDYLKPPQGSSAIVLLRCLTLLCALPASARDVARMLLRDGVDDSVRPWLSLPVDQALHVILVGMTLHALGHDLDLLTLRGAGVEGDVAPFLGLLEQILQDSALHDELRQFMTQVEQEQDNKLDRLVESVRIPSLAALATVVEGLTPHARDRLVRRALEDIAVHANPAEALCLWSGSDAWAPRGYPDELPMGNLVAAVTLFARVARRLASAVPAEINPSALADAYIAAGLATLEFELAQAMDYVRRERNSKLTRAVRAMHDGLRRQARSVLNKWDTALAERILDANVFNESIRSISQLIELDVFRAGRVPPQVPHVWLIIFDGMRWDTWHHIMRPALEQVFELVTDGPPRFTLLPSFTEIARRAVMAGRPPCRWLNTKGLHTNNEETLGALGFSLTPARAQTEWRLVKHADEDMDLWVTEDEPRPYNTIIYSISDDRAHKFGYDLAELNRELNQRMADRVVQDLLTAVGDQDVLVVTSDHGFVEMDVEDGIDLGITIPSASIHYRFVTGAEVDGYPSVDLQEEGLYTMAVGRQWFKRPGGSSTRYSHGGITFDELLVPGAVFRRSGTPRLDLHWRASTVEISGVEGELVQGIAELVNSGNRPVHFTLTAPNSEVQLEPAEGTLAARDQITIAIRGEFRAGRLISKVGGEYGLTQAMGHRLEELTVGIRVDDAPGKVEIDFSPLGFFDEE